MPQNRIWSGKRVLIADDSKLIQTALKTLYEKAGMVVVAVVGNGVEALAKFRELKPDLVSLDILMPEMSGIECYRLLKKETPDAQCLFVSCLSGEARVMEAFATEIPAHFFMPKPATQAQLEIRLNQVFGAEVPGAVVHDLAS